MPMLAEAEATRMLKNKPKTLGQIPTLKMLEEEEEEAEVEAEELELEEEEDNNRMSLLKLTTIKTTNNNHLTGHHQFTNQVQWTTLEAHLNGVPEVVREATTISPLSEQGLSDEGCPDECVCSP